MKKMKRYKNGEKSWRKRRKKLKNYNTKIQQLNNYLSKSRRLLLHCKKFIQAK